jgi:hypothetical protein
VTVKLFDAENRRKVIKFNAVRCLCIKIIAAKRPLLLNISEFTYQTGFDSLERLVDAQNGESDES